MLLASDLQTGAARGDHIRDKSEDYVPLGAPEHDAFAGVGERRAADGRAVRLYAILLHVQQFDVGVVGQVGGRRHLVAADPRALVRVVAYGLYDPGVVAQVLKIHVPRPQLAVLA